MASHEWIGCLGMLIGKGGPDGVLVSDAQYEHHVEKLIQDIQAAHVHVLEVLKPLGTYLTTEDNVPRTRAILFLAEVCDLLFIIGRVRDKLIILYVVIFYVDRVRCGCTPI